MDTPETTPMIGFMLALLILILIGITMGFMNFKTWIDELIGPDSYRRAAQRIGSNGSTITRQLDRGRLAPEMVISLCRGYNRSPVTGLIETGYLQEWEAENVGIPFALRNASNQQILDEILRRSDPEALYLFGDPTNEAIDYDSPVTNLDEHRSNTHSGSSDTNDGTVTHWNDDQPYAADSSPDETEERLTRGEDPID